MKNLNPFFAKTIIQKRPGLNSAVIRLPVTAPNPVVPIEATYS